jgi:hypothetical protein
MYWRTSQQLARIAIGERFVNVAAMLKGNDFLPPDTTGGMLPLGV